MTAALLTCWTLLCCVSAPYLWRRIRRLIRYR